MNLFLRLNSSFASYLTLAKCHFEFPLSNLLEFFNFNHVPSREILWVKVQDDVEMGTLGIQDKEVEKPEHSEILDPSAGQFDLFVDCLTHRIHAYGMVYPTFGWFFMVNVGKYMIHGSYG